MSERSIVPYQDLRTTYDEALREGAISKDADAVFRKNDLLPRIQIVDEGVPANNLILLSLMPDDSGSIEYNNNIDNIIQGHNRLIESINELGKNRTNLTTLRSIRLKTEYLNGKIINNWVPADEIQELNRNNYGANGGTPLYDRAVEIIGSSIMQREYYMQRDINSRIGILLMSDGEDEHSVKYKAEHVRNLVFNLMERSDANRPDTVAFLGVPGQKKDFRMVANEMGIMDQLRGEGARKIRTRILTPKHSLSEFRHAVDVFSKDSI